MRIEQTMPNTNTMLAILTAVGGEIDGVEFGTTFEAVASSKAVDCSRYCNLKKQCHTFSPIDRPACLAILLVTSPASAPHPLPINAVSASAS